MVKGTFPALMLAQVNFDALYQQALQQAQQEAGAQTETEAETGAKADPEEESPGEGTVN